MKAAVHPTWLRRNKPRVKPDGLVTVASENRGQELRLARFPTAQAGRAAVRDLLKEKAPRGAADLKRRLQAALSTTPRRASAAPLVAGAAEARPVAPREHRGSPKSFRPCHGAGHTSAGPCLHRPDPDTVRIVRSIRQVAGNRHILKAQCLKCHESFEFAREGV